MTGKRFIRGVSAALVAGILAVSGTVSAAQMFLCRYDQVVRVHRCCNPDAIAPALEHDAISAAECCEVRTVDADRSPSEAPRRAAWTGGLAIVSASPLSALPFLSLHAVRPADVPRGVGPPIVLLNRSLLI